MTKEAQAAWCTLEDHGWRLQQSTSDEKPDETHDSKQLIFPKVRAADMLKSLVAGEDVMWYHDHWAVDFDKKAIWIDYNTNRFAAEALSEIVIPLNAAGAAAKYPKDARQYDVIFYEIKNTGIKGGSTADMFKERFPVSGDAETGFKMPISFTERRAAFQIWASDAKASIMLAEDLLNTMQGTSTPGVKTVGQAKNLAKWLLWFKRGDTDKALQRDLDKLREKIDK